MSARRLGGAVAGALVAGLGISALLIAGERRGGEPSELALMERRATKRLGIDRPRSGVPDAGEQVAIQGGHLLLSAAAGAVFAAATDEDAGVVVAGAAFGVAFYGAMHWVLGPALGLKPPEWRSGAGGIGLHAANHLAFGLATAAGARLARRGD